MTSYSSVIHGDGLYSKLLRYAIVGLLVASTYFVLYFFLRQFAWPAWAANVSAYVTAVWIQFPLQSRFTFRHRVRVRRTAAKFYLTVSLGYLFSLLVTSYLVPAGYVSELLGSLLVIVLLPILNLLLMFVWVFTGREQI